MAGSMDPPISPWAERFGVSESYPWKDENKSAFHPTHPDIDVKDPESLTPEVQEAIRTSQALPMPSYPELDRLFLDERHQRNALSGFFVWQSVLLGALRDTQPVSTNLDETSWLPLVAKERWYNLNRPLTDSWQGTLDSRFAANATWTVDDPVLWEKLSPAIQLTSNLLRATVQHPFLDAILGVKTTDIYPNYQVAEGLDMPLLAKNNTPPLQSEQQLLDILKKYAEKLVITFMPPGMPGELGLSYGITASMMDPNLHGALNGYDFAIVMLNPDIIWPLLAQDGSASSKAQATLILAVTFAHEMMHAIFRIKNMLAPKDEIIQDEPLYAPPGTEPTNSAWISEIGISWEQSIIGGTLSERPKRQGTVGATGGGLSTFSAEAPNWAVWQSYVRGVDPAWHEPESWYGYTLPAFVAEIYCSDELWQIHYAKYGLPALRPPKLLRSCIDREGVDPPETCQLEYVIPEFRSRLEELGRKFDIRGSQWKRLRPWYDGNQEEWDTTPYSRHWLRDFAGRFRVAHRTGDEWAGQTCYRGLGVTEKWGDKYTSQYFLLDKDQDWIDQAVAYLMMLVMPVRTDEEKSWTPFFARDEHGPSDAAIAGATSRSELPFQITLAGGAGEWEEQSLATRNIPFVPDDPLRIMGNRATLIAILRDEIPNRQLMHPIPDPLFQEVKAMFDNIEREAPRYQMPGQWLSDEIRFVLPPWQPELAKDRIGYAPSSPYEPYNHSAQPRRHSPGSAATPPSNSGIGSGPVLPTPRPTPWRLDSLTAPPMTPEQPGPGSESSGGAYISPHSGQPRRAPSAHSARRRVAHSARRSGTSIDETYYTVGEVGNHLVTGSLWIVSDDGARGYDVYHATDVMEELWADEHAAYNMDDYCEWTLIGLKARPRLQRYLEEQGEYMGKLILPMRRHEIAERDGRHGRPFWISVGNNVFDITNFPFESEHQRELMRKCPGGNPWSEIMKDTIIDYDQLLIDLKPYRCAVVASQTPEKGPGPEDELHFTHQEVACHVYPETTMYTIIRGYVYDLTGYMEFHPGGETILRQWAGRDSTHEFEKYHTDADRCLKDFDYLRLGRLVEEKPLDQLTHNEVALNGHVYDLSMIDPREPVPPFVRAIDSLRLRGRDITGVVNDRLRLPPKALLLLPQRPDLITAKVSVTLPEIDLATLQANDGRRIPLPEAITVPRSRVEADLQMPLWVSHDGLVYDMSAVSKWGPEDVKAQLNGHGHRYRGAVIPPSALATRLRQDYSCRVIGRLSMRSRRSRDEGGSDSDEGDDRSHQRIRLR